MTEFLGCFGFKQEGERMMVRRAGRYTSEELHRALFEEPPHPRGLRELKEGVQRYVKARRARRLHPPL